MKKIMVPVDGSACSLRAVDQVIADRRDCAEPDGYEVHVMNVQVSLPGDVTQFFSYSQVADYHREESAKAMREAEARLTQADVPFTSHTEKGPIAQTIVRRAGELGCTMIVMGTHGRGALHELLVGSITIKVVHLAKVPVLLVK